MGIIVSAIRNLVILYQTLTEVNKSVSALLARLSADPHLPVPHPTQSFWQQPASPLANVRRPHALPEHADIVILGSGITAAAVARTILSAAPTGVGASTGLKVVVLEARGICSGATGRNGGHIKVSPHIDYAQLKTRWGAERARRIVEFRRRHLYELMKVANEERCEEDSEVQCIETVDVYFDTPTWKKHKKMLTEYLEECGKDATSNGGDEWDYIVWEGGDAREKFSIPNAVGAITYPAGSLSPYGFVTTIWSNLLSAHRWSSSGAYSPMQHQLSIQTETPCLSLKANLNEPGYAVSTPRGTITANHVIHCTNSHVSHLLPAFRGKIFPVRGQVTAQTPSNYFPNPHNDPNDYAWSEGASQKQERERRSWCFMFSKGFDYLTLRPPKRRQPGAAGPQIEDNGILIFGGGLVEAADEGLSEFGVTDDGHGVTERGEIGGPNIVVAGYLAGLLHYVFREPSSATGVIKDNAEEGRVLSHWTGIMGWSSDMIPFVGPLSTRLCGRKSQGDGQEWICAGYTGEGMVNAWGSGVALGAMVRDCYRLGKGQDPEAPEMDVSQGVDPDNVWSWFPKEYVVTEKRVKEADPRNLKEWM